MKEKRYSVYIHCNKVNGKVYIGMTSLLPSQRFGCNGQQYSQNSDFYSDIQKYGWDSGFTHEILFTNLTGQEACKKERELIAAYRSTDKRFGYNVCAGGERVHRGYKLNIDDAERERRRQNVKDPAVREKNSQKKLGDTNPMYGKYYGAHHRAIPVRCIETGLVYSCAKEAGDAVGVGNTHITAVCRGKRQRSGGYRWEYA
ncbi:MAG: GIY-YIG nuclease family protein [Clostridia bacterium]|nr:GIY-YIG nuclease family protein [Clostridia bacterium]